MITSFTVFLTLDCFYFQKFNLFLQNPNDDGTKLTAQLKNIDGFLSEMEHPFLCGTTLSYSDTVLLSRLQHIRVAGKVMLLAEIGHFVGYFNL